MWINKTSFQMIHNLVHSQSRLWEYKLNRCYSDVNVFLSRFLRHKDYRRFLNCFFRNCGFFLLLLHCNAFTNTHCFCLSKCSLEAIFLHYCFSMRKCSSFTVFVVSIFALLPKLWRSAISFGSRNSLISIS